MDKAIILMRFDIQRTLFMGCASNWVFVFAKKRFHE